LSCEKYLLRRLFGQVIDQAETAHAVLGVERGASRLEVREAYIRLVKRFHPDINSGDLAAERRFKRVNQAYEELKSGYPSRHHELGAFPRRRQHRHGAIVFAAAAALFAFSPALVLTGTLAAWKTVPLMAAQPRIEPAKVTDGDAGPRQKRGRGDERRNAQTTEPLEENGSLMDR